MGDNEIMFRILLVTTYVTSIDLKVQLWSNSFEAELKKGKTQGLVSGIRETIITTEKHHQCPCRFK